MADEIEVWLPGRGDAARYWFSNLGRSRGPSGKVLAPTKDRNGYWRVSICGPEKPTSLMLHRLVLSAFCGEPPFEGAQACHNDGDKDNCRLANLRWASAIENQKDVERHGRRCRGERVYGAVLTENGVREIKQKIADGLRNRPIAEQFGVSISTIHLIRHGETWRHV
jgi:hypothetical protein